MQGPLDLEVDAVIVVAAITSDSVRLARFVHAIVRIRRAVEQQQPSVRQSSLRRTTQDSHS